MWLICGFCGFLYIAVFKSTSDFKIYLTGSFPAKFCGTAKLYKVPNNGTVDELPLKPIISNIWMAAYNLAKYLV